MDSTSSIAAICHEIERIESSGEIAPPLTWISSFTVIKPSGKRYIYYRLMEATDTRSASGKMQGKVKCYLGSAGSAKYKRAKEAIARRNRLQILQRQLKRQQERTTIKLTQVSAGHNPKQPPLTSIPSPAMWQQLQQNFQQLTAAIEQLTQLFNQEKKQREALAREIEWLKKVEAPSDEPGTATLYYCIQKAPKISCSRILNG